MVKIFITGSKGQLGRALNAFYSGRSDIELINTDVNDLDITDEEAVLRKVLETNPDIIINCAAYTKVDDCEEHEDEAYQINAAGIRNLCRAANKAGAAIVHISTDYVFDGEKKMPYVESDAYAPQSAYGRTKMAGEQMVRQIAEKYFIVRTAWLYGEGKNFVDTMLQLSESRDCVRVVSDQFGTPTSAEELVKVINLLIQSDRYGIYHATCEGSCNWAEFAKEIFRLCGRDTKVGPVTTEEYGAKAKRPAYSVLENRRLADEFGYRMQDWKPALEKYLSDRGLMKKEMERL